MTLQNQPRLRRLSLIGTPLLTGILLPFHPRPDPVAMGLAGQTGPMDVYTLLSPVADRFLVVHVLFAPALALLGLSVILLISGLRGITARISRVSAFVFIVSYIMYETIIGTAIPLIIRGAAGLPPDQQAMISDVANRIMGDPFWGDPSVLFGVAWLSWIAAVTFAAFALRRSGTPRVPCILLGLSAIFVSHASLLGLVGMLLFLIAVVGIERAGSPVVTGEENDTRATSYSTSGSKIQT